MKQEQRNASAAAHNKAAWDRLVRQKQRFTRAASDDEFKNPLQVVDGKGWLGGNIRGQRVLCLAAGGGRQAPLYAAAGADVTVVDVSAAQLEIDREVAAERGLKIQTVETSMDDLNMFAEAQFEIVIHPVSTCYLPDLRAVYPQIARITQPNGLYISQHKQPTSLQADVSAQSGGYLVREPYYRDTPLPAVTGSLHREEGTLEFLHRWEQLVGLMCRAGFWIEDLVEPLHAEPNAALNSFGHRSQYIAPYVRIKARRRPNLQPSILTNTSPIIVDA